MSGTKKKIFSIPKRKPTVKDPVLDAEARYGTPFVVSKTVSPWEDEIARHTTLEFAHLGKGFKRHCGPTAITNLILTLDRRYGYLEPSATPQSVFTDVSAIGRKKGIYWNTDVLHHAGGTYDVLTGLYITSSLKHFGIPLKKGDEAGETEGPEKGPHGIRIGSSYFASKRKALRLLDEGKLLYLQLSYHPIYGNHHLLACGYTILHSADGLKREGYLILADGWSARPRYLRLSGLGIWHYLEVS